MPDDLILVLDAGEDLVLEGDDQSELILADALPYAQHYTDYTGAYTVTPILHDEQELLTRDKHMTDNVTVKAIPVVETTNPYGGRTIVIG